LVGMSEAAATTACTCRAPTTPLTSKRPLLTRMRVVSTVTAKKEKEKKKVMKMTKMISFISPKGSGIKSDYKHSDWETSLVETTKLSQN